MLAELWVPLIRLIRTQLGRGLGRERGKLPTGGADTGKNITMSSKCCRVFSGSTLNAMLLMRLN